MLAVCAQCHRANRRINRDIRPREFRRHGVEQVRLASLNFNSTLEDRECAGGHQRIRGGAQSESYAQEPAEQRFRDEVFSGTA